MKLCTKRVRDTDSIRKCDIPWQRQNIVITRNISFRHALAFRAVSRDPSVRSQPNFVGSPVRRYSLRNRRYLDFHKMRNVPGFRSAGHILLCLCWCVTIIHVVN